MIDRDEIVAALVDAAGGTLIGRVRLQKTLYLLEQLGLGSEMPFEYHHYGPYSRELDNATADAKALGRVKEDFDHRQSDGAMYSIFRLADGISVNEEAFGNLGRARAAEHARLFAATNVTVLELAATVDWLWRSEGVRDWRSEVANRKGKKVQGGRLEKAVDLLGRLGLQPPEIQPLPNLV